MQDLSVYFQQMNPFQYLNVECSSVDVIKNLKLKKSSWFTGFVSIKIKCIFWTTVLMIQYVVYDADKYWHQPANLYKSDCNTKVFGPTSYPLKVHFKEIGRCLIQGAQSE